MNETSTHEPTQLFGRQSTTNGETRAARSSGTQRWEREAKDLDDAIEEDSAAIARLLRACASSRDFGVEQLREFEKLFRHRRHLIVRLERLQQSACLNPDVPTESADGN